MTATHGQWMGSQQTALNSDGDRLFILHAILMRTGKVLCWSGHAETVHYAAESHEWDPVADPAMNATVRVGFAAGADIFCCHQTNLEDGRVMSVGGSQSHHGAGIRDICIYDPDSHDWTKIGDMSIGRWYPTLVTLADGSVLAFSGRDDSGGSIVASVEHFRLPIVGPGYAPIALGGGNKHLATYPGLHLATGGRVIYSATTWRYEYEQASPINTFTFRKTGDASGGWTDEGISPAVNNREEGMSVLLPPAQDGKILVVGGGWWNGSAHASGSDLASAAILDTRASPMSWRSIPDMHRPRVNVNTVLLPDGKVLVHGGHDSYKWSASQTPSNIAELYDPVLDSWTDVAQMTDRRTYHSASLLLPDGQVLAMGGVDPSQSEPGTGGALNQRTYEFYRPPYFFKGTRPTITAVTRENGPAGRLAYGGTITVTGTSDTAVLRVALMRPGAMTHHTDSEQRYIALDFIVTDYNPTTKAFTLRAGITGDANIAPPGWYMLWVVDDQERPSATAHWVHLSRRQCFIVTDRSHFARDELNAAGNTDFAGSFYVIMDGFMPVELGITTATPSQTELDAWAPAISFAKAADGTNVTSMQGRPEAILLETGLDVPQRIAFRYTMRFTDGSVFDSAGGGAIEDQQVMIHSSKDGYSCHAPVRLTHQPRPFMLDGEPAWLSTDLRVFNLTQNSSWFGQNVGNSPTDAVSFMQNLLNAMNGDPAGATAEFDALGTGYSESPVYISANKPGTGNRVYNFAVAKVRYRARSLPANNVRVFFRLFRTMATGVQFQRNTTYRTVDNGFGERIPALGVDGGQTETIPFYAEARVNTAVQSLTQQRDQANRRDLPAVPSGSDERVAFFGCWLDINQTAGRFPLDPSNATGPFSSGLKSIQELLRGAHCCMVAEVDFGTDWLQDGDSPGSNDSLSQRNLAIVGCNNPGITETRTVVHTFEVRASAAMPVGGRLRDVRDWEVFTAATPMAFDRFPPRMIHRRADELMIEWGNLPPGTSATIYMPGIEADELLDLHSRRPGPDYVERVDGHTLTLIVGAERVTYLPLPPSRQETVAALFSIRLPDGVRKRQLFRLTVRQIDGMRQVIIGSCEWAIPVTTANLLLPEESSRFAVFQHIAQAIPPNDQWRPIFDRYLDHQREKVRGLGGNPDRILPSPEGDVTTVQNPEAARRQLCCRLRYIAAIFMITLILALVLPLPPAISSAGAILSAMVLVSALLVGLWRCPCD